MQGANDQLPSGQAGIEDETGLNSKRTVAIAMDESEDSYRALECKLIYSLVWVLITFRKNDMINKCVECLIVFYLFSYCTSISNFAVTCSHIRGPAVCLR